MAAMKVKQNTDFCYLDIINESILLVKLQLVSNKTVQIPLPGIYSSQQFWPGYSS